jgi:hypothetical protein
MIRFATSGIGVLFATLAAAAQTFVVPPELWDRPRSGRVVLEQPAIRQAVNACLAQPGSRLIVRHAPGQESLLAAEELRSWLGALAVEPGRISLRNDLKASEPLQLDVARD